MFGRQGGVSRARAGRRAKLHSLQRRLDAQLIALAEQAYPWVARIALFVVYFWFGLVKLIGLSEATPLARALTARTVGLTHFQVLFTSLAVFECMIGLLCLIPRATRVLLVLLCVHLAMVCAPEVLVRNMTWQTTLVPTMDGQYIIKNVLIVAAAVGLLSRAAPLEVQIAGAPAIELAAIVETEPAPVGPVAPHRQRPRHIVHRARKVASRSRA